MDPKVLRQKTSQYRSGSGQSMRNTGIGAKLTAAASAEEIWDGKENTKLRQTRADEMGFSMQYGNQCKVYTPFLPVFGPYTVQQQQL